MTDTPLDLDAILANAEVGRATYLPHLDQRDLRAIDRARKRATDDVLALVAALRKAEAQVAAVLAECRKVATVSGNASGYPYVLVNTIVGAIERAS